MPRMPLAANSGGDTLHGGERVRRRAERGQPDVDDEILELAHQSGRAVRSGDQRDLVDAVAVCGIIHPFAIVGDRLGVVRLSNEVDDERCHIRFLVQCGDRVVGQLGNRRVVIVEGAAVQPADARDVADADLCVRLGLQQFPEC